MSMPQRTDVPPFINVQFEAIAFVNGLVVIESSLDVHSFWVELGPSVGWGRFDRMEPGTTTTGEVPFVLRVVRPGHESTPSPIVSSLGVLWRRQAACEAQKRIAAFQRAT